MAPSKPFINSHRSSTTNNPRGCPTKAASGTPAPASKPKGSPKNAPKKRAVKAMYGVEPQSPVGQAMPAIGTQYADEETILPLFNELPDQSSSSITGVSPITQASPLRPVQNISRASPVARDTPFAQSSPVCQASTLEKRKRPGYKVDTSSDGTASLPSEVNECKHTRKRAPVGSYGDYSSDADEVSSPMSEDKHSNNTEDDSSSTIGELSPDPYNPAAIAAKARLDACDIVAALREDGDTQNGLPGIYPADEESGYELSYSPPLLLYIYLEAYREGLWNICDLVADTWIRAIRAANNDETNRYIVWRENKVMERMKATGSRGFEYEHAPKYKLPLEDPIIDSDVARINDDLLSELYDNTEQNCGARLLWSDAMALCGSGLERLAKDARGRGVSWHPELVFDVMSTSLRMVRRKLTLKIEESTEGAWCQRYHEHSKHGLLCYRELAWKEKVARGDSGAEKRRFRDVDDSPAKRVRFADEVDDSDDGISGLTTAYFDSLSSDYSSTSEEE